MKAHVSKLAAAAMLAAVSLLFAGCYYIPGVFGHGMARVTAGPPPGPLPPNITSIVLIVGGPGMDTITQSIAVGNTTTTLSVPSGIGRTFTLLENTPSVTLVGNATVDLAPGETKNIALTPTTGASQIVVPDWFNSRLVQISDMNGTGWTTQSTSNPYAVDFDAQGRIYVASYASVSQISDITNPSATAVAGTAQGLSITSMAIDRTRGLLYFTDGSSNLYSYNIQVAPAVQMPGSPLALSSITAPSIPAVTGLAVDSDGFLYIANNYLPAAIQKVDVSTFASPKVLASNSGSITYPWDVLANGDYIYVSDFAAKKIVRLTRNLSFVDSFSGPSGDPFLGPERFVAILNKPITVIDETASGPGNRDRLVSFNDMTGAGWKTYGSTGNTSQGPGYFMFYIS